MRQRPSARQTHQHVKCTQTGGRYSNRAAPAPCIVSLAPAALSQQQQHKSHNNFPQKSTITRAQLLAMLARNNIFFLLIPFVKDT